jgi:hypothetical protein
VDWIEAVVTWSTSRYFIHFYLDALSKTKSSPELNVPVQPEAKVVQRSTLGHPICKYIIVVDAICN